MPLAQTVSFPKIGVGVSGKALSTDIETAADLQPVTGSIWKALMLYGPLGPQVMLSVFPMPVLGLPLLTCHPTK